MTLSFSNYDSANKQNQYILELRSVAVKYMVLLATVKAVLFCCSIKAKKIPVCRDNLPEKEFTSFREKKNCCCVVSLVHKIILCQFIH